MFIQYLAQQGHNVVKSERKPRKVIQYKDLEKKEKEANKDAAFEKGQRTLNGTMPSMIKENGEGGQQKADKPSISPRAPSLSTLMVDRTVEAQTGENDRDVEMVDQ
ncbi:hypothetical protein ACP6JD_003782 [Aspergillus fumigatus]